MLLCNNVIHYICLAVTVVTLQKSAAAWSYVRQRRIKKCLYNLTVKLSLLTSEVLSCSSQQLVENVEGALIFGLTNSSGFLQ